MARGRGRPRRQQDPGEGLVSKDVAIALLGSAVIAAIISAVVTLSSQGMTLRQQEKGRRREMFAKALAGCVAYREFPFAIRRRRADQPEAERIRLSEAIQDVQQQLAFHAAWIDTESTQVGAAYRELLRATRILAGQHMHDAWLAPATTTDDNMNIPGIDYSSLASFEAAYMTAVRKHLSLWRRLRRSAS